MDEPEIRAEGAIAALGDAIPPPEVSFDGKLWKIGHPTQGAKAELEKLVVKLSEDNLEEARGVVSPARFASLEERFEKAMISRAWQTWGALWSEAVNGPDGFVLFLLSLLKPHHPKATIAEARALWLGANRPCRNALIMVLPDFFDQLAASLPIDETERRLSVRKWVTEILAKLQRAPLSE